MGLGALSIVGGVGQALSANKAAKAQTNAANAQIDEQRRATEQMRTDLAPWREGGMVANDALLSLLGLGQAPMIGGTMPTVTEVPGAPAATTGGPRGSVMGAPGATRYSVNGQMFDTREAADDFARQNMTGGQQWGGFQADPGYAFRLGEGTKAIEASAAARGGLYSGATMRDLNAFGQNFASNEYGNFFNRLAGIAGSGQNAAAMSGQASMNAANNIGNSLGAIGNAKAAGAIGMGNALSGGINNITGLIGYQQGQNPGQPINWGSLMWGK